MFVIPFRMLQPRENQHKKGRSFPFWRKTASKSPQFLAFWGDSLRGRPKIPKIYFQIAPQKRIF